MADVHPNPLNNRKCPRPGGGGGGCYCLLACDLLQLSTLAGAGQPPLWPGEEWA